MKTKGIRQTARGWEVSIQLDGKRKTALCKTKSEATARRKELERQLLLGERSKPKASGDTTLAAAIRLCMDDRWAEAKSRDTFISHTNQILDFLGRNTLITAIDRTDLLAMQNHFKAQGNMAQTVIRKMATMRTVFGDALDDQLIEKIPKFPKSPEIASKKKRVFTGEEERKFIDWFRQSKGDEAADIFIFLLDTCARWSEVEKLKVWDVCLTTRKVTFEGRKANNTGSVPLTDRSLAIAKKYQSRKEFMFDVKYDTYNSWFNECKFCLGIDDDSLQIHSTRHTCATRLAEGNMAEALIMLYGGWTTHDSIRDYLHCRTDALLQCVDVLEGHHR